MTTPVSTRRVAALLRGAGFTVVVGLVPADDRADFWVIGEDGAALILSACARTVERTPGMEINDWVGRINAASAALISRGRAVLQSAGIATVSGKGVGQLFLNGYRPRAR